MRIVDLHTVHTGLLAVQQDCTLRITTTATAGGRTVSVVVLPPPPAVSTVWYQQVRMV